MAHQIDESNGNAAFVSYKQAAWHGLGKTVEEELSFEQALEFGGINFEVEKLPNIHRIGGLDVVSEKSFFTYRKDNNIILGDRLGSSYTVMQNIDALSIAESVVDSGHGINYETVGSLKDGRSVFITLKLPNSVIVANHDEVDQYLCITNSHDGTSGVSIFYTPIRVVCANTLSLALRKSKNKQVIRHTRNVNSRVKDAENILKFTQNNTIEAMEVYNHMANTVIKTQSEFFDYIGNVYFTRDEIGKLQKGEKDAISTYKQNIVSKVLEYSERGVGQKEAKNGNQNYWWAYNAATGYEANVKAYASADKRFTSLIEGTDVTAKAMQMAANPSLIVPIRKMSFEGSLN